MTTFYWIIGNNLKEGLQIDLTADTQEEAEQMAMMATLQGYECHIAETNKKMMDMTISLRNAYESSREIKS